MAKKLNLEELSGEIADRARAVFSSVVNDLDKLFTGLGAKLSPGVAPSRKELLRIIAALRKSLDARLSALEKAIGGGPKRKAPAKKAVTKAAKKVVKKAAKAPAKKAPSRRR